MEENQIIDVSKIKIIPSDTEIPVHNNSILTKRPLCTNFPDNTTILDRTEAIKVITDISEDLNKSEEICVANIPQYIEDLQAVFNPLTAQECTSDLFKDEEYTIIETLDELKKYLSELLIRFDTSPNNYTKEDYLYLLSILYKSLIYLYLINPESVITTEWTDPLTDNLVPSEKLVKETIDSVESLLDEKINQEIEDRQSEITRVEGLIGDINELIPEEASSNNQLADKEFVHDLIATNASNFRGDWSNWSSVPTNVDDYPEDYTGNKKPNNNDYLIILNATDYSSEYTGIWRFYYQGNWDELGKSGWQPQYRVEQTFTQELLNAINSGITSGKVSTYDGYANSISTLLSDKVDKVHTSNKVYGTDSQGSLTTYTAGDGISFTNGLIINTRTSAAWGNITGTLSNLTDLLAELDSCVTSEEVQSVGDVTAYVSSRIPVIDKTSDSSSSFAIDANKMYMFGTRSSLTITLNAGESGIVNEYMFQFTSGSTATTLNVPNTVTWLKDPDILTNKKYLVSIENNLGIIGEWDNE